MSEKTNEKILNLLRDKIMLKQEVFKNTTDVFLEFKTQLSTLAVELLPMVQKINSEWKVEYKDRGELEAQLTVADETLMFIMHANIFTFDKGHPLWKDAYIQKDTGRAYCGKIYIYNFLSDSFKYNRVGDHGYLLGRIFINKEKHFFIEGEKQLEYLYNDFSATLLDQAVVGQIIDAAVVYSLDYDPFTPAYDRLTEVSLGEILESSIQSRIATGNRLGFKFQSNSDFKA